MSNRKCNLVIKYASFFNQIEIEISLNDSEMFGLFFTKNTIKEIWSIFDLITDTQTEDDPFKAPPGKGHGQHWGPAQTQGPWS